MNLQSLIGHLNEIYNIISGWKKPVDLELQRYYRSRKYMGSKDRRFVSDNLYFIIRNHRLITHIVEKHFSHLKHIDYFSKLFFINYILSHENNNDVNDKHDINVLNYFKEIFVECDKLVSSVKEELSFASNDLSLKYSFPDWMLGKFSHIIPEQDMENFLDSLNQKAPTAIRIIDTAFEQNVKKDFEEKSILLSKSSIAPYAYTVEKRINFNDLPSYQKGYFEVQDLGSQLVTLFVEPFLEGEIKILDACAGAGGKSLYLSKLLGEKGTVYAYDLYQKRLDAFRSRINPQLYTSIPNRMYRIRFDTNRNAGVMRSTNPQLYTNIKFINSEDELQALKNKIDILLIDAPCTGIGTIRRNPDLKWRLNENDVLIYAEKQLSILENYASYLKQNGRLVYITCSFLKEENEDVITLFLKKHPEFKFYNKLNFCDEYNIQLDNNFLRLYPHKDNSDGFSACHLYKITSIQDI